MTPTLTEYNRFGLDENPNGLNPTHASGQEKTQKPKPNVDVILRAGDSPLKIKHLRHVKGGSTGRSTYVKTSADLARGLAFHPRLDPSPLPAEVLT